MTAPQPDVRHWMFCVTVGSWGEIGFGHYRALGIWRLCLGFVAFALVRGDLLNFAVRLAPIATRFAEGYSDV